MFTKPNKKLAIDAGVQVAGAFVGVKVCDAVSAALYDVDATGKETALSKYKDIAIAVAGAVGAACVDSSTTGGKALKSMFVGLSAAGASKEIIKHTKKDGLPAGTSTEKAKKGLMNGGLGNPKVIFYNPIQNTPALGRGRMGNPQPQGGTINLI